MSNLGIFCTVICFIDNLVLLNLILMVIHDKKNIIISYSIEIVIL